MNPAGPPLDVQRFLRLFLDEASDHLTTLEGGLLRLEESSEDREVIDGVFRAAHSLKGGSSTFGLQTVSRLTHAMESLLDRMRTGSQDITPALTSLLLGATDELRKLLAAAQNGSLAVEAAPALMAELEQALAASAAAAGQSVAPVSPAAESPTPGGQPVLLEIHFRPGPDIYQTGGDPVLVLRELAQAGALVAVEVDADALPTLAAFDPERSYLGWRVQLRTQQTAAQIREVFAFVEDGSHIDIRVVDSPGLDATMAAEDKTVDVAGPPPAAPAGEAAARAGKVEPSTMRVAVDKVDKLINLVGELVIAQSMISQAVRDFTPEKLTRLHESVGEMERNIRELQERVMTIRMVPLSSVLSRVPRLVRDLAASLDKKIAVQIVGGDTEIDKSVIEQLGDPLIHLVRNAVDHGIETPADRLAAGKPEQGRLKLSAFHQGGNVVIQIEDDGRGLDGEKIRKKALSLGLIQAEDVLTPEQAQALIFRAGFSTADKVSDISGRGVGMDVVRTNIEALNGSIALESEAGRGTRLRISLPLTLAIIDGLSVGVGDEVYVVPLVSIVESFRPALKDIRTIAASTEVVCVRDKVLPLLRLRRLLAVPARRGASGQPLVVIIENQGNTVGLLVDEIQGQAQVVIKSLESNYRRIDGVMGATIMGDGKVALILDVQGLVRIAHGVRPAPTERQTDA